MRLTSINCLRVGVTLVCLLWAQLVVIDHQTNLELHVNSAFCEDCIAYSGFNSVPADDFSVELSEVTFGEYVVFFADEPITVYYQFYRSRAPPQTT